MLLMHEIDCIIPLHTSVRYCTIITSHLHAVLFFAAFSSPIQISWRNLLGGNLKIILTKKKSVKTWDYGICSVFLMQVLRNWFVAQAKSKEPSWCREESQVPSIIFLLPNSTANSVGFLVKIPSLIIHSRVTGEQNFTTHISTNLTSVLRLSLG